MDNKNYAYIDTLRGLSIVMVVAHHFSAYMGIGIPYIGKYGGLLGVQLFFIISGYLIAKSADTSEVGSYIVARIARIFPAYWIAYLAIGFLSHRLTAENISQNPIPFIINLLNLQHLDPVALIDFNVLSVTWTLTVELLWYALAPLIIIFGKNKKFAALLIIAATSFIWSFMADTGYLKFLFSNRLQEVATPLMRGHAEMFTHSAFPAQLIHFGWGLAIYWYRVHFPLKPATLVGLTGILILIFLPQFINKIPFSQILSGFALALIFVAAKSLPNLHNRLLSAIGLMSYSMYLIHFPAIVVIQRKMDTPIILQATAMVVLLITLSYASYRFVEQPGIKLGRRISERLSARRTTRQRFQQ